MSCVILFPHQLFDFSYIKKLYKTINETNEYVVLWEHSYFFNIFPYHKLKLAFHRASMKYYYEQINTKKIYVESKDSIDEQEGKIKNFIKVHNIKQLLFFNPIEKKLLTSISEQKLITMTDIKYIMFPTPYFLNSSNFDKNDILKNELSTPRHDIFYKKQRINYNIMVTNKNNKIIPENNIWSYDKENRNPFDKGQTEVKLLNVITKETKKYIDEAIKYVNLHYSKNYGTCDIDDFIYPINRTDALKWLNDFVKRKLSNFGKYEDAISTKIVFGYHSVLSPLTNIGLINPNDIINKVKDYNENIASKEGFIRQLIGWREYCYYIYNNYYDILIKNFFYKKSNKSIPKKIWICDTKIPIIDHILSTVNKYAYSHHIERLMCIGNFMLLIDISPIEIYKWFQTMYIDAYDVFMVPNVYGMLLYGFVGEKTHMMTKPYFCSSNYLLKMSDFKSCDISINDKLYKWNNIFDALYYRLIHNYSDDFSKIYSVANAVKRYNDFSDDKKKELMNLANLYINWIYD